MFRLISFVEKQHERMKYIVRGSKNQNDSKLLPYFVVSFPKRMSGVSTVVYRPVEVVRNVPHSFRQTRSKVSQKFTINRKIAEIKTCKAHLAKHHLGCDRQAFKIDHYQCLVDLITCTLKVVGVV